VNDIDSLIRDRLTAAATFDVVADPRRVRESVARRQRRIRRQRRGAGLLCVLAAAGLGAGAILALDRDSRGDVTVQVTDPPERESDVPTDSGWPRFLPAPGWDVVQVGGVTTASNIQLGPETRSGSVPWDTVERLEEGDVVLYAGSGRAGESTVVDAAFPPGELPLSIDDAHHGGLEGQPDDVYAERMVARVNGWNIDVLIFYRGTEPSAGTRAIAQDQLSRLDVPPRTVRPLSPPPEDSCQPSNLHASFDLVEAAGMLEGQLRLRNIGDSPCALEGVPHIELRDPDPQDGGVSPMTISEAAAAWQQANTEPPKGWPTVNVNVGSEAHAVLTVGNWCIDSDEPPPLFIRLPYHVDRIRDAVTSLDVLPQCEDPRRPVELSIGPLEPPRTTEG
jgi:hypothetical protein